LADEGKIADRGNLWVGRGKVVKSVQCGRQGAGNMACSFQVEVPTRSGRTTWVRVNCFDKSLVGYIKRRVRKGSQVEVEGELMNRQASGGSKPTLTEIRVFRLSVLPSEDKHGSDE